MPAPAPAPPPWKLAIPEGRKDAAARIRDAVNSAGEYYLEEQDGTWLVERRRDPPELWRELDWKIHRFGETGSRQALLDHLETWSTIPGGNYAEADGLMQELEKRDKPSDAVKWAEVARYTSDALMAAPSSLASIAQIAKKLLEGFPNGQMVVWGKNSHSISAGRPEHLFAGAGRQGVGSRKPGLVTLPLVRIRGSVH